MKYGMTSDQYQLLEKLVIAPLKSHGAKVYLFGSRVSGQHHPHSDVDLLFETQEEISPLLISQIRESIEESMFPFSVDLVASDDLANSYRAHVMQTRQEI